MTAPMMPRATAARMRSSGTKVSRVTSEHPDPDGGERGLVGARVHVDGLKQPDLAALRVDHVVVAPVPDVLNLKDAPKLPLRQSGKRQGLRCANSGT